MKRAEEGTLPPAQWHHYFMITLKNKIRKNLVDFRLELKSK